MRRLAPIRSNAAPSIVAAIALLCTAAGAQEMNTVDEVHAAASAASVNRSDRWSWRFLARDQKSIFMSPARIPSRQWAWILPAIGGFAYVVAADGRDMSERIHTGAAARDHSLTISNIGAVSLAAIPPYLYWRGWRHADEQSTGTATLAARAAIDSVLTAEILRVAADRGRPDENASGRFFHGGPAASGFPSLHSAAAWSIASVIARRYPGWLTEALAYGTAATVSVSRVTAREHFPSDVIAGGILGYLVGRFIGGEGSAPPRQAKEPAVAPAPAGSSYVPLESWIYGALDQLAALGLIPSQTSGLRPWTRAECRRQLREAEERSIGSAGASRRADELIAALRRDLDGSDSGGGVVLESIYFRNGVIAGPLLNDSFHFGQTWINDFGRPFGRGWNSYEGFTARAESGRFFAYVQGEYQHAPGMDACSPSVCELVSRLDGVPSQVGGAVPATNRFRLLDSYAGVRLGDIQFSVGKQSMWWGPTYDAPLSFSDNAEPTKNLKASLDHPIRLPGVLSHFGDIRGEFVIGKLGGQKYTWRPWFNAQKLSFKLTENLEMGFTRWSIFWGVGHPITAGSFIRNFTSTSSPPGAVGEGARDPGDRKGGFDFRYRVPGARNWLTLYSDSYCDDDPSPLANPRRAALNPGIYLARVPAISRLDFRVEAPSTTPPDASWDHPGLNYYNGQYRSGNTNYGTLLGNPVGRDARALQAWTAYHVSPRTKVEAGYRHVKGSTNFLAGGFTQSDASVKASFELSGDWRADWFVQCEQFYVPLLGSRRSNVSGWIQLSWQPELQISGKRN